MGAMPGGEIDDLADQIAEQLNVKDDDKDGIELLAEWIESGQAKRIMILCGAGVSVAAGIPDFRSPGTGLYDRNNPQPFCTLAKELWPGLTHSPTLTHSFLKLLSDKGLLLRNYSQNIDGLEFLAGMPAEELVECHGHFRTAACIDCKKVADGKKVKDTIVQEGQIPKCKHCGGNVKPDIVFFGESLPARFHNLLQKDIKKADLLLVMGTSLQVAPVSMIPDMVRCNRVLFNRELVLDLRTSGDMFIEGDCDTNVEKLCELLGWKDDLLKQNAERKIQKKVEEETSSEQKD
jgi:NAD-dependent SIR2 family protein deacetylase